MALPLTIIGGFLGAGKTTLLKHLLENAEGRRLAVLVNDFGAINIDSALINTSGADSIELSNGCVCCSLGDDLVTQLIKLEQSAHRFDHIVIEASGVGDPWKIAQIGMVAGAYRLDSVIVVIDTETVVKNLKDELIADSILRQVARADIIVANKADISSEEQRAQAKGLLTPHLKNSACQWIECIQGEVDITLALGNFSTARVTNSQSRFSQKLTRASSHTQFCTLSFTHLSLAYPFDEKTKAFFNANSPTLWHSVLRGKAIFRQATGHQEWHRVGSRVSWSERTTNSPVLVEHSQLVLIGKSIDLQLVDELANAGWTSFTPLAYP